MAGRLAIIACAGALPVALAEADPEALVITLEGVPSSVAPERARRHRLEEIGALFAEMRAEGVARVVFAGALRRPALDPARFDPEMAALAPRLMAAMAGGDDGLLRTVIAVFEAQGFAVIGAAQILPALVAEPGLHLGPAPAPAEEADIARAAQILRAIAPLDIGQGCVVAGGQCLGIETAQGTDALLDFVAMSDPACRRGFRGVCVKAAKSGQDLRIDMPAIGPQTVAGVARAGLAGLVVEAGKVLILERDATLAAVRRAGIFLSARGL
ncbi:MAG: UDP-2,3-diacylglucosamine diphosphatase LpxI [Roseovarius sp.]